MSEFTTKACQTAALLAYEYGDALVPRWQQEHPHEGMAEATLMLADLAEQFEKENADYTGDEYYDLVEAFVNRVIGEPDREAIKERLEYLRGEIEGERISYEEIAELQGLKDHIEPGDVVLREWAGVPEGDPEPGHKWSVLVDRPGERTEGTFLAHVRAPTPREAHLAAVHQAVTADGVDDDDGYDCLLCVRGWVEDRSGGVR